MNAAINAMNVYRRSNVYGDTPEPPVFPFTLGDDLLVFLDESNLYSMLQEEALTGVPITNVVSDGDPVGLIYSGGFGGFFARAENSSRRPLLASDIDRFNSLSFDGIADYLAIPNTAKYLRKFNESGSTWCIMFWIKMGASTNGVFSKIMTQGTSSTNVGINIDHTAANKLEVYSYYASSGNTRFDKVSTANLNEAAGWVPVIIYANGNGAAAGTLLIGNNAPETFTIGAVGSTADATNDLRIGASFVPGSYFKGNLSSLMILNRIPTADEITEFKAFNPERNTTIRTQLRLSYDFNNTAKGWADANKTIPITNGVGVRAWETEQASPFGGLNRDLTSASAGASPIFNTLLLNGYGGLDFDGISDTLTFAEAVASERGGRWTLVIVCKNDDATDGSHMLHGSSYIAVTGSNYSGNPTPGQSRVIPHLSAGDSLAAVLKNQSDGYNVFIMTRNGSEITIRTGANVVTTVTNSNFCRFTSMGTEFIAGWMLDGKVIMLDFYSGVLRETEIASRITAINTKYAI